MVAYPQYYCVVFLASTLILGGIIGVEHSKKGAWESVDLNTVFPTTVQHSPYIGVIETQNPSNGPGSGYYMVLHCKCSWDSFQIAAYRTGGRFYARTYNLDSGWSNWVNI